MRFANISAAFALVASAQAWVIPEGSSDGVYSVSLAKDGTEIHTKLADFPEEKREPTALISVNEDNILEKRTHNQIWCGCGFNMNSGNCDAAVSALKAQLGAFIKPKLAFYSIRNDVVAFACNRDTIQTYLLPGIVTESLQRITDSCGRYIAGATQLGDDGHALIIGYARFANGDDFCAGSTSSPANHC